MNKKNISKLIFSILICQTAGVIGSIFTTKAIPGWYAELAKPSFSPPNWIFGPVWIFLYFLMGIALYLVWTSRDSGGKKTALIFFGIQLALNSLWSIIFFGLKSPFYAFIELCALLIMVGFAIWKFWKIRWEAGALLLPYIAWGAFAAALNFAIFRLN